MTCFVGLPDFDIILNSVHPLLFFDPGAKYRSSLIFIDSILELSQPNVKVNISKRLKSF